MAKQTFTTGSVLTATQMNNLNANDYNWTVNQKTTSYILVASDVGTRIEMNSGSATTVTVNTGIFAAGDTLFIQNIGSGVCTVTAGTATVNKASTASLALAQWQGGYLYFISASSAVFFADAGFTSPLTTKGDIFTWDTGNARLPVGSNGQVLTAQSGQSTGLQWATAGGGTLLQTLTLSGTTTTTSSIAGTYRHLTIYVEKFQPSTNGGCLGLQFNSDTGTNYVNGDTGSTNFPSTAFQMGENQSNSGTSTSNIWIEIPQYQRSTVKKHAWSRSLNDSSSTPGNGSLGGRTGAWDNTAAITTVSFLDSAGGSSCSGTAYIYGVN
jgi:hypothetical protein